MERILIFMVLCSSVNGSFGSTLLPWKPYPPCVCYQDPAGEITANCSGLRLPDLPPSIPVHVTHLLFGGNSLDRLSKGMFKRFTLLKFLDLSNNQITSIDVHAFTGLGNLISLTMHGNGLLLNNKTYPAGVFKPLVQIATLDISRNDNTTNRTARYNDKAFADLVSLKSLLIDGIENVTFGKRFKYVQQLTSLTLSGHTGYCSIINLSNNSFIYLSNIEYLDISNCKILVIEPNAFWPMRNIKVLDLSSNRFLTIEGLGVSLYGLRYSTVKVLNASWIRPPFYSHGFNVKLSHLQYLNTTHLEELYLDGNGINTFDEFVPTLMKELKIVSLRKNRLLFGLYIFALNPMINLKSLDMSFQDPSRRYPFLSNNIYNKTLEETARNKRSTSFHLQQSMWGFTFPNCKVFLPVPPNLRVINGSHSHGSGTVREVFPTTFDISVIDISYNLFSSLQGPIHNITSLTYLDVSYNYLDNISSTFLKYAVNLRVLNLSRNVLDNCLQNDINGLLFYNQYHLEILHLSNNGIRRLPRHAFINLNSLKNLDVSTNELSDWSTDISHMLDLVCLDMTNNRFENIPLKLRQDIDFMTIGRPQNLELRVSGNNLKCDCVHLASLEWMSSGRLNITDLHLTKCKLTNGETVRLVNLREMVLKLQQQCRTVLPLVLGAISGISVFLIVLAAGLIYRYRWKIRYLYYTTRRRHRGYQRLTEGEDNFVFDAFVSYADEDRAFVVQDMRDVLERRFGLKLCIHHRDFLCGEAITANIVNAIQSSRRTIVLLSPNFLKSSWCDYEVNMAKMESVSTGRNVLCVVVFADVPDHRAISGDLLAEMATGTYIKYPTDEEGRELFWQSLRDALTAR